MLMDSHSYRCCFFWFCIFKHFKWDKRNMMLTLYVLLQPS